jgi:hypothetical protein
MSQTPCKRCRFPPPIRWPRAGGDLTQPNGIHQCADRASMCSENPPKCLQHSPDLAYVRIRRWHRPAVPSIIDIGAGIKSS